MQNKIGWYGISFPLKTTNKGGMGMSDTEYQNPRHLEESIVQILTTKQGERAMHPKFGSNIDYSIFDVYDDALVNILKYEIKKALDEQEPRIHLEIDDISISGKNNVVYVNLDYTVVDFGTVNNVTVNITI